jgi:hypothetical protein
MAAPRSASPLSVLLLRVSAPSSIPFGRPESGLGSLILESAMPIAARDPERAEQSARLSAWIAQMLSPVDSRALLEIHWPAEEAAPAFRDALAARGWPLLLVHASLPIAPLTLAQANEGADAWLMEAKRRLAAPSLVVPPWAAELSLSLPAAFHSPDFSTRLDEWAARAEADALRSMDLRAAAPRRARVAL